MKSIFISISLALILLAGCSGDTQQNNTATLIEADSTAIANTQAAAADSVSAVIDSSQKEIEESSAKVSELIDKL